jgi:hypothetical protein
MRRSLFPVSPVNDDPVQEVHGGLVAGLVEAI